MNEHWTQKGICNLKQVLVWARVWEPGTWVHVSVSAIHLHHESPPAFFLLSPALPSHLFSYSFHFKSTVSWLKMHLFWSLHKCSAFLPVEGSERAPQPWRYIINTLPEPLIPCPSLKYHYRKDFNKITAHYTLKFDFKRCLGFAERH